MRKAIAFIIHITIIATVAACAAVPSAPSPNAALADAPTFAELAAAHNQRVSQLSRIQSRGVIEIVWRDAEGVRRFRQGDVDLYIDLPRRTALRVSKLGNVYMWLGSDEERYWLFDLVDEHVLYTGLHDSLASSRGDQALHTVQPIALLDLIGIGPLTEFEDSDSHEVEYDRRIDAWIVRGMGGGGPVRIFFDRSTRLPQRIETLGPDNEPVYYSDIHMQRYRSVPVPGISAATLPRLATLVDIFSAGPNAEADGRVKLALDSPTGRVDEGSFERVFEFDRLRQSLRPQRIEGDLAQ